MTGCMEPMLIALLGWATSLFFIELETEAEIFKRLGYFLWSPGDGGKNARYQANFDFGSNLGSPNFTCDTKIGNIQVRYSLIHSISLSFFKGWQR